MRLRQLSSLIVVFMLLVVIVGIKPSIAETSRSMGDLEPAVSGLLAATADDAFLIVWVSGSDDFVQIAGYRGTAELDFPQITDRQKQFRSKIEEVCEDLGLALRETRGSDGSEFLDYDLPSNAAKIAGILRRILVEVYGATESDSLEFEANGFDIPAS